MKKNDGNAYNQFEKIIVEKYAIPAPKPRPWHDADSMTFLSLPLPGAKPS